MHIRLKNKRRVSLETHLPNIYFHHKLEQAEPPSSGRRRDRCCEQALHFVLFVFVLGNHTSSKSLFCYNFSQDTRARCLLKGGQVLHLSIRSFQRHEVNATHQSLAACSGRSCRVFLFLGLTYIHLVNKNNDCLKYSPCAD